MNSVQIFVIADNLLARAGLAAVLAAGSDSPEQQVVGQSAADSALAPQLRSSDPDLLVWDFGWNTTAMLERLSSIVEEFNLPALALVPDDETAAAVWAALGETPARGLLRRDTEADALYTALAAVAQGLVVLDPLYAEALLSVPPVSELPPAQALTPRESEVLQLLAEGLANKTIAAQLGISENTVKFHVNAILSKLNAQSRTEAVVRATRLGWVIL